MRPGIRARRIVGAAILFGVAASSALATGCRRTRAEPGAAEPVPPEPVPAAAPDASTVPDAGPADVAGLAPPAAEPVSFHLVVHSAIAECTVSPFDGADVILCGSFLAVVHDEEIRQDPAWLAGASELIAWMPEWLELDLPIAAGAPAELGLPDGALLSMATGNRSGPVSRQRWTGGAWAEVAEGSEPRDPRIAALGEMHRGEWLSASLPSGHLFVVRKVQDGPVDGLVFEPGSAEPSRQEVPLPASLDSWSALGTLVAASSREAFLCTRGSAIARYRDGLWAEVELPEGRIESCAATAHGTLWVTTGSFALVALRPDGSWETLDLPGRRRARRVAAAGGRLWVVAMGSTDEGGGSFVYSSRPVSRAVEIAYNQTPFVPEPGIVGLDDVRFDVPSVGASPPGPGTSACSSPVLYLGRTLTPATRRKLGRTAAGAKLEVVQVAGTATGTIVWPEDDGPASVAPSTRKSLAVAVVPASYDDGQRLIDLLAPNPDPFEPPAPPRGKQPRLLCAIPRVVKSLGPVGDHRIDLHGRPCPVTPQEADDPCPGYRGYASELPERP